MGVGEDLAADVLAEVLPRRAVRSYPALLSTQAAALAWARAGAPEGAVVTADYQAAPRGRAGLEWGLHPPGESLGFSLVLRPALPPEREGWLYPVAASAVADVLGEAAEVLWPDEIRSGTATAGKVCVDAQLGSAGGSWAVVTVLLHPARPPRGDMLAGLVHVIESRAAAPPEEVLADYLPRCATLGRTVRARLLPVGPAGPQVSGTAVTCLGDGALVLETVEGNRVAVRPQHLGRLDDPAP